MRLLALFLLVVPAVVAAQGTGMLAGRVVDESGEGLRGVNVLVNGTTLGAVTDADGDYRIRRVPAGEHTVTAASYGSHGVTQAVTITNRRTLDFILAPSPTEGVIDVYECFAPVASETPFAPRVVLGGPNRAGCSLPMSIVDLPVAR